MTTTYRKERRDCFTKLACATQPGFLACCYEMVEEISVEATDKQEAKRRAERKQTYNGELMDTLHTSKRQWGEYSPASLGYLEEYNFLPDDHDVTEDDLAKVMDLD